MTYGIQQNKNKKVVTFREQQHGAQTRNKHVSCVFWYSGTATETLRKAVAVSIATSLLESCLRFSFTSNASTYNKVEKCML